MNSINQQQPEENHKDLSGPEAIQKLKDLAEDAKTCFFCSDIKTGVPISARPMTVQKVDEAGNLLFLSATDSNTDKEIKEDAFVQLFFQGSKYSDYLNIYGIATLSQDKALIKELWQPTLKTWFTEGEDDPRISVISVEPTEVYYWDNKHGNAVAFVKQLVGAAIGKTLDDSIEGKLEV
jgi:general stress protein 26